MSDEADFSVLHKSATDDRVQKSSTDPHRNNSVGGSSNPVPNPRSCVTCRKRKVKCDKKHPCSNCARAKIECIFPGPGRAPRKSRKLPDGELMERLRKLEGVVQTLNAQVEENENENKSREESGGCPSGRRSIDSPSVAVDTSVEGLENRFGRLVVDEGRSRYINNSFWASLNNEVEDLKSILIEPSDDEADQDSPDAQSYASQHQSFMFGYSSSNVDMLALHPSTEQAHDFWAVYKENVDPLVKVLHVPTVEPKILDATHHPESVPKGLECLLFAIYYGAVTSIMPEDCRERWGEDRQTLLSRYRFALEQALARANFLYCDETIILQAFVVFLILLRRNDDARKIWTLTGLVVRIAQTLGIHRDGSHFDLPPFEIEMRRRLWWQVCILDARASEDHGCDPTIVEAQFDTKMPLNINDSDLEPNMNELPEERVGFTDMTFCIIRFEVASIFRRILYIPPGPTRCTQFFAGLSIPEKEKWISECHQRLEDKYLKQCDMTVPLYWVTATISRLVMSKMWLMVYHPHQRRDGGASLPQETKDKLFITSLENIEYSILLETEARTMKWGWLFRTYVQWHAIAFLLSELCVRTKGEAVERAWRALEATAGRWWFPLGPNSDGKKGKQGCLWKPLRKLMAKARAARERELALEKAAQALKNQPATYRTLPQILESLPAAPSTAQPNPEQLDSMLRPCAPRLGTVPGASPPSWPAESPLIFNDAFPPSPSSISPLTQSRNGAPTGTLGSIQDEARYFQNVSNMGFDYLMQDIMQTTTYDGPSMIGVPDPMRTLPPDPSKYANQTSPNLQLQSGTNIGTTASSDTNQKVTATSVDGINMPATNGFAQSPISFTESPFNGSNNSNTLNQSGNSDSPELADGTLDWENWDDLVGKYGMDIDVNQIQMPTTNPAGAGPGGMLNWF